MQSAVGSSAERPRSFRPVGRPPCVAAPAAAAAARSVSKRRRRRARIFSGCGAQRRRIGHTAFLHRSGAGRRVGGGGGGGGVVVVDVGFVVVVGTVSDAVAHFSGRHDPAGGQFAAQPRRQPARRLVGAGTAAPAVARAAARFPNAFQGISALA